MANTIKTMNGELLADEVEAVVTERVINLPDIRRSSARVTAISKSGQRYELTPVMSAIQAEKVATATGIFVAGVGHQIFDPSGVK
jgi:hypothetical protein